MIVAYYLLIIIFYLIYFSKQITSKREGIATNQLGKGEKPQKNLVIERLLLVISLLMGGSQFVIPVITKTVIDFSPLRVIGLVLMLFSVSIFLQAVLKMSKNWRAGIDFETETNLVTTGIYSFSRNPAFLAFNLLYWGSALVLGNIFLFLLALIATLIFHQQILLEEAYLKIIFTQEYLGYCLITSRYFSFTKTRFKK